MKMKVLSVVAACVLALTARSANADTFQITGTLNLDLGFSVFRLIPETFTGQLTIDPITETFSNISVNIDGGTFTSSVGSFLISTYTVAFANPNCTGIYHCHDWVYLEFSDTPSMMLVNHGGYITDGSGFMADAGNGATLLNFSGIIGTPTPLPPALPLFATGLGVLGLFGWRTWLITGGRNG